jgi:O-succinylbenzoate synthase
MKLRFHPYQLPWNPEFARSHSGLGALVALEINGHFGYADLHPWPSAGDLPLEEQLERLREGKPTPQTQLTLAYAERDARAREKQQIGVRFQPPISNHYLFLESRLNLAIVEARIPHFEQASENLFAKWKLKPELVADSVEFLNLVTRLYPFLKWRLDANALFSAAEILHFWQQLKPAAQQQIDFIEDPCPYEAARWNELEAAGIPLAIDFEIERWQQSYAGASTDHWPPHSPTASGQTTFVLKPAVQELPYWQSFLRQTPHPFLLTSYLDHPVGLLHALWWAESCADEFPHLLRPCGLNLGFSEESLHQHWPELKLGRGPANSWLGTAAPGIGLTHYLEGLEWQDLNNP